MYRYNQAFIGRFRTPATSKVEIFMKEVYGGKPLIIKAKHIYHGRFGREFAVNLHLCLYYHSVWNSWCLIILIASQWACQRTKSYCTKNFFLSHFPKKLCEIMKEGLGTMERCRGWGEWCDLIVIINSFFMKKFCPDCCSFKKVAWQES